jgi:arylamine N-acetyltransferase
MLKREPTSIERRALGRLGVDLKAKADLIGLRKLYRAWCLNVPFDNILKVTAIREDSPGPLPGTSADEFLADWMNHGAGGTCWPSSNALFALLEACGFEVGRAMGSMAEGDHCTVIVRIDEADWLVDTSFLTLNPLPLSEPNGFLCDDPLHRAEVESTDDGVHVWWAMPRQTEFMLCTLTDRDLSQEAFLRGLERSRAVSAFNDRLFAKKILEDSILLLLGNRLLVCAADQTISTVLSGEELRATMIERFQYSSDLIERWAASGALEASVAPYEHIRSAPIKYSPPSQRP